MAAVVAPAIGAPGFSPGRIRTSIGPAIGYFTPAAADPKLSAIYGGNSGMQRKFRFTPAVADLNRSVTVAVRANRFVQPATVTAAVSDRPAIAAAPAASIQSGAFNLGSSVGWQRFALKGDSAQLDRARLPSSPDTAKAPVSAAPSKWNTRVQLEAAAPAGRAPRTFGGVENVSVDVGGAYRLSRNLDVTAGVRYKTNERDRLERLPDTRRDNQAVYIGTAFRF